MCGIAGFTHKNWSPDPDRIQTATSTLIHRGPDEQGVYRSDICSLGATRLKIIDLVGGDQPITSDDGEAAIVFNGEIYNHLELRAELESLGHRFQSHCDTETVFRAFLEWDTDAFARLRGMFAVALWTTSTKRLVLARDRMGIKPLYIARQGEELFFGSELKAILVHPEIERRLSLAGLDCYLSLNYVPAPWTLVDGIEKVLPGHWVEWRDGQLRTEAYWRLPEGTPGRHTLESASEELDSLLQQSVREHLVSDVPLGVWLSGGIDSSTILHYAANASSSRLKTFSISFRGRSFDETEYIQQAAKQYATDHEQLDLNPEQDLQGAIEEFAYYSDEPSADAGALPVWFLSKLCKTRTTVALSGEGADELFGGYLTYRANRIARHLRTLPSSSLRLALSGLRHWPVSDEKISFEYQAEALAERQPDAARAGARVLEWDVFRGGETISAADEPASALRWHAGGFATGVAGKRRSRSLSGVRSEVLPSRRHPGEVGPHEHGPFGGGAAALPRSPHRRVCGHAAGIAEDSRLAAEVSAEGHHEGQAARRHPAAEEDRLRYSGTRMASRATSLAAG